MKKKDGSAVAVNLIKIAMVVIGCLLVIAFVVGFIFFGIGPTRYLPDEGTWYCEELQIQLCFDEGDIYGTHYYDKNGDKLLAIVIYEPGTRYFSVNPKSGRNISLFTAQCMDVDDEKMVVVEEDTGVEYTFTRLDGVYSNAPLGLDYIRKYQWEWEYGYLKDDVLPTTEVAWAVAQRIYTSIENKQVEDCVVQYVDYWETENAWVAVLKPEGRRSRSNSCTIFLSKSDGKVLRIFWN